MAELSPGAIKLLPLLDVIQEGAASRDTTAQLWTRVQTAANAQGFNIAGAGAISLGEIRSWAVGNRNATAALNAAPANASLEARMLGAELYTRSLQERAAVPLSYARFQHTVIENGVEMDIWRTSVFRGLLPPTKDQLRGILEGDAVLLADEYNQTHVGVGDIALSVG